MVFWVEMRFELQPKPHVFFHHQTTLGGDSKQFFFVKPLFGVKYDPI